MQILTDIRQPQPGDTFRPGNPQSGPLHLTIGNFDGVHRGHQALLQRLIASTQRVDPPARSALLTFDPHPLSILRPDFPLQLLTTPQERLNLAASLGIDVGIRQTFTQEVAALSARDFVELLVEVGMTHLVVGPDFALGRGREGTLDVLQSLGNELGYTVEVMEAIEWSGVPARSSEIRRCLQTGDVERAAALLGRLYSVCGSVQHGDERGRTLGVPTANVHAPPPKLLPAHGVYATWAQVVDARGEPLGARYASVTNVGVRPTVDGREPRVEAHLLDFPAAGESTDLYDRTLCIEFVQRLREEQRFDNLEALTAQIRRDIKQARAVLEAARVKSDSRP